MGEVTCERNKGLLKSLHGTYKILFIREKVQQCVHALQRDSFISFEIYACLVVCDLYVHIFA